MPPSRDVAEASLRRQTVDHGPRLRPPGVTSRTNSVLVPTLGEHVLIVVGIAKTWTLSVPDPGGPTNNSLDRQPPPMHAAGHARRSQRAGTTLPFQQVASGSLVQGLLQHQRGHLAAIDSGASARGRVHASPLVLGYL
jgi:hypothetical protein